MRKKVLLAVALAGVALAVGAYGLHLGWEVHQPIVVGILHARSASEQPLINAELMALAELNEAGGLLGRPVKWVIADSPASAPAYADQARRLIEQEKVSVIFGGDSSASRKAIKPVVEDAGHLLIYPPSYEGLEISPHIVYTGGPANQQVMPAVNWCREALKARNVYLVGSDALYSRVTLALVNDVVKAHAMKAVGEEYISPGSRDAAGVVERIVKAAPDVVISTLEGDANLPFYERLQQLGVTPERLPVVSLTVSEEDLRSLPARVMTGHYGAWNYMQSIDRPVNHEFVRRFKARYGRHQVTSDGVSNAYNAVWFWAQAVTEAKTADVSVVRRTIRRQSLDAPEGVIAIDYQNLNAWRSFVLGKIQADGQFEIVYALPRPIPPVPFPRTRSKAKWAEFVEDLNRRWGGQWTAPVGIPARGTTP